MVQDDELQLNMECWKRLEGQAVVKALRQLLLVAPLAVVVRSVCRPSSDLLWEFTNLKPTAPYNLDLRPQR